MLEKKAEILARFQCQGSGNCCRTEGFVYVTDEEMAGMAAELGIDIDLFRERYVRRHNGWPLIASPQHRPQCFLNNEQRCQVYKARPSACRSYPDWPGIWASEENLLQELSLCPGLRKAYSEVQEQIP